MNIILIILTVISIVNFILLFLMLSVYKENNVQQLLINQMHVAMGNIVGKLHVQEIYIQKLGSTLSEFTNLMDSVIDRLDTPLSQLFNGKGGALYKTIDGKYTAGSLEDLVDKLKGDGVEDKYLSDDELTELRNMFEIPEDDSDDDADDFNPDKGKF